MQVVWQGVPYFPAGHPLPLPHAGDEAIDTYKKAKEQYIQACESAAVWRKYTKNPSVQAAILQRMEGWISRVEQIKKMLTEHDENKGTGVTAGGDHVGGGGSCGFLQFHNIPAIWSL